MGIIELAMSNSSLLEIAIESFVDFPSYKMGGFSIVVLYVYQWVADGS